MGGEKLAALSISSASRCMTPSAAYPEIAALVAQCIRTLR